MMVSDARSASVAANVSFVEEPEEFCAASVWAAWASSCQRSLRASPGLNMPTEDGEVALGDGVGMVAIGWLCFFDRKFLAGGFIVQAAARRMASSTSAPESVFWK